MDDRAGHGVGAAAGSAPASLKPTKGILSNPTLFRLPANSPLKKFPVGGKKKLPSLAGTTPEDASVAEAIAIFQDEDGPQQPISSAGPSSGAAARSDPVTSRPPSSAATSAGAATQPAAAGGVGQHENGSAAQRKRTRTRWGIGSGELPVSGSVEQQQPASASTLGSQPPLPAAAAPASVAAAAGNDMLATARAAAEAASASVWTAAAEQVAAVVAASGVASGSAAAAAVVPPSAAAVAEENPFAQPTAQWASKPRSQQEQEQRTQQKQNQQQPQPQPQQQRHDRSPPRKHAQQARPPPPGPQQPPAAAVAAAPAAAGGPGLTLGARGPGEAKPVRAHRRSSEDAERDTHHRGEHPTGRDWSPAGRTYRRGDGRSLSPRAVPREGGRRPLSPSPHRLGRRSSSPDRGDPRDWGRGGPRLRGPPPPPGWYPPPGNRMPSEPPGYAPYPPARPRERAASQQRPLGSPAQQRQRQRQRQEDREEGEAGDSSGEEGALPARAAAVPTVSPTSPASASKARSRAGAASADEAGAGRNYAGGAGRQHELRERGSKRDWESRDDPMALWRQQQEAWVAAGSLGHPPPPAGPYPASYHMHPHAHPRAPSSGGSPLVTAEALRSPAREPTPGFYLPQAEAGAAHPPGETYHMEALQEQYGSYGGYYRAAAAAAKGPDMLGRLSALMGVDCATASHGEVYAAMEALLRCAAHDLEDAEQAWAEQEGWVNMLRGGEEAVEEEPFSGPEFYQQPPEDALVQEGDPIPLIPLAAATQRATEALPDGELQHGQQAEHADAAQPTAPPAAGDGLPAAGQPSAVNMVCDPRQRYQAEYAAMDEWLRRGQPPPQWALPPKEPEAAQPSLSWSESPKHVDGGEVTSRGPQATLPREPGTEAIDVPHAPKHEDRFHRTSGRPRSGALPSADSAGALAGAPPGAQLEPEEGFWQGLDCHGRLTEPQQLDQLRELARRGRLPWGWPAYRATDELWVPLQEATVGVEDVLWPWHSVAQHIKDSQAARSSLLSLAAAELSPAEPAGVAAPAGQAAVKQEEPPPAPAPAAEGSIALDTGGRTDGGAAHAHAAAAAGGVEGAEQQQPAQDAEGALRCWFDSAWQAAAAAKDLGGHVRRSMLLAKPSSDQQQQGQLAAFAGVPAPLTQPAPPRPHPPAAMSEPPTGGVQADAVEPPRAWLDAAGQEAARMVANWRQQQRQPVKRVWGGPPPPCLSAAVRGKLMHNAAGIRQALNQVLDAALGAVIQRQQRQQQQRLQQGREGGESHTSAGRQRGFRQR
ncbi:hypothetical protein N2152v2_002922 [Parachlorella kessleri]